MSSFSCWAVVDLLPARSATELLDRMWDDSVADGPNEVLVKPYDGSRVYLFADFQPAYGSYVRALVPELGARAVIGVDWDEYGVEHRVLGPGGKLVHSAVILEGDDDADTQDTRRRAAELFDVDVAQLDHVSATWASEGAQPWMMGQPFLRWWDALGVGWPDDFHEGAVSVRTS